MPARTSYDYAVIRIVPRVEREEFINAGVVLYSKARHFLGARVGVDEARLRLLDPQVDLETVWRHLNAIPQICSGDQNAGDIAKLSARERFHWLVAPRSTIIQFSPVHAGLCDYPALKLDELFSRLVAPPDSGAGTSGTF
ncbi:MAG TPA: DUF3037 domain-containing protein [Bryobacteraceae bacterium]|nr:DUF3037 domain-containing protein [Bryobacteraceae bacterium]